MRLDVVVTDPQGRGIPSGHTELLLDMHFPAYTMSGSDILQTAWASCPNKFPSVQSGVVGAQRARNVVRFAVVTDDAKLIEDRSGVETHGAPIASSFSILF